MKSAADIQKAYNLAALNEGESAVVTSLESAQPMRGRLLDLGLVAGTRVECVQKSIHGDIAAYSIRGAIIAIRQEDAKEVLCV